MSAVVGGDGIEGDRAALVVRGNRIVTSRTHPKLLRHHATFVDGAPRVNDLDLESPEVAAWVRDSAGDDARLVRYDGPERFDILPLLVATDGAIAAMNVDSRRFRPNIIIGGVEGLAERTWEGKSLRVGDVVIRIHDLRQRCVMTTWDPDTQAQDLDVLRRIVRDFDGRIALNCSVEVPGTIAVGDSATIF